ncbi:MAG: hypothetical protein AAFX99_02505 [Myxococcota bacterium]
MLERRLSSRAVLMWVCSGSYGTETRSRQDTIDSTNTANPFGPDVQVDLDTTTTAWRLNGGLGGRWIINPGGLVELSPFLLLSAAISSVTAERESLDSDDAIITENTDGSSWAVGLNLGLIAERELVEQLWIRISLSMLEPTYTVSDIADAELIDDRTEQFAISASFRPSLELRLQF